LTVPKVIVLGVSSSISIYKACEILRGFQKKNRSVQVIMTPNAAKLVSPLLFTSLSGRKSIVDPFEDEPSEKITHVDLAKEASLLCVAPATANVIGKFSQGVADDFLSTFYTVVECPVLIAPAMNEAMYFHRQTQENIERLKALGVKFIEPDRGYLACRDEGWGRLASPEDIVEKGMELIASSDSLRGKTILVTAGPTREYLDPVRFLTNRSSGRMGYEIAEESIRRGAEVTLVSGPVTLPPPRKASFVSVQTADEMARAVKQHFERSDVVIMAAAVGDFTFSNVSGQKIKKTAMPRKVELSGTEDILLELGKMKKGKILVGFAAETEDVVSNALKKIKAKNLDLVVANDVSEPGVGFESSFNRAVLVYPDGKTTETGKQTKAEISRIILDEIEGLIGKKG